MNSASPFEMLQDEQKKAEYIIQTDYREWPMLNLSQWVITLWSRYRIGEVWIQNGVMDSLSPELEEVLSQQLGQRTKSGEEIVQM
jgi:hypothetical protein